MHVIDLSYFVKKYRSKNKHISVNFLRHFHRPGDLLIATVLSGISLTAYAAQPMSNLDSGQLRPAGTVSATGASNLSDLEDKLAEKAREQGAKGYVINSAGGNDQMFGTATIYK